MRLLAATLLLGLSLPALAQVPPDLAACAREKKPKVCGVSKKQLAEGKKEFARGLELRRQSDLPGAFAAFERAAGLVPKDVEYATAREIARQQLVLDRLQAGNDMMAVQKPVAAAAAFRQAVQLDPSNAFARQRLGDALGSKLPSRLGQLRVVEQSGTIEVAPTPGRHDFHFRGNTQQVIQQITRAFGIKALFDDSVPARQLVFDVGDADFASAMDAVSLVSHTFWTPVSPHEVLIAADRRQERLQYERMALRTFQAPGAATPKDLNEIVSLLRTVFDIRFVTQSAATSTVTVRAPQATLEAATRFLESLDSSRPQVMLDIQVFEVSHSLLRAFGLDMPLQWSAFNLGSAALALLAQPNVQDLINQLIASGGINQASTQAISALLAQVQSQQNSLLQQPFGTFGGGTTLFAVPFPPATVNLSLNESRVTTLEHLTLRAAQGDPATLRIGSRYPVLNATFAPIYNTAAISQVLQNQSFVAPFPSFSYEDLGITVKATPLVHGDSEVTLQLELAIKTLSAQSFNGVPVIANREYKGGLRVTDGEAGVVAGILERSEQEALQGLPGISKIPGVSQLTSNRKKQNTTTELLVVITPHIVRAPEGEGTTLWLPGGTK